MTTKQRAYLKSLAMTMEPIFQIGKNSMTPELTKAISEALEARELIKISVLKNCADDPKELAFLLAERTRSQVVQVIGKKIVLYKEGKDKNIRGINDAVVKGESLGIGGYLDIGLIDTMKDLIVNFIGAVVFSIIGYFYIKNRGKGRFAKRFIPRLKSKDASSKKLEELVAAS